MASFCHIQKKCLNGFTADGTTAMFYTEFGCMGGLIVNTG